MQSKALTIPGSWVFEPSIFPDRRGRFVAPFQSAAFTQAVGHSLTVAQVNHSESRRGVIRGVHFADVPPGQAKYVYCARGALLDVVVDLRLGSPTFGQWDAVELDGVSCRAVYLSEGLGHAFLALEPDTVMSYLCSTAYDPTAEHGVNPLDPALGLPWPAGIEPVLSDADAGAPSLADAAEAGTLPSWTAWQQLWR